MAAIDGTINGIVTTSGILTGTGRIIGDADPGITFIAGTSNRSIYLGSIIKVGQIFNSLDKPIYGVQFSLAKTGNPNFNISAKIVRNAWPYTAILETSSTVIAASSLTTSDVYYHFPFSGNVYNENIIVYIEIEDFVLSNASNYISTKYRLNSDIIIPGVTASNYADWTTTFSSYTTRDVNFKLQTEKPQIVAHLEYVGGVNSNITGSATLQGVLIPSLRISGTADCVGRVRRKRGYDIPPGTMNMGQYAGGKTHIGNVFRGLGNALEYASIWYQKAGAPNFGITWAMYQVDELGRPTNLILNETYNYYTSDMNTGGFFDGAAFDDQRTEPIYNQDFAFIIEVSNHVSSSSSNYFKAGINTTNEYPWDNDSLIYKDFGSDTWVVDNTKSMTFAQVGIAFRVVGTLRDAALVGNIDVSINPIATTQGFLTSKRFAVSVINPSASTASILKGKGSLGGNSNASTSTVSALTFKVTINPITVIVNGVATTASILKGKGIVQAVSNTAMTTSGVIKARGSLVDSETSTATTAGILTAKGRILVAVNASASLVGIIKGKGLLLGVSNGVTTKSALLTAKAPNILIYGQSNIGTTTTASIQGKALVGIRPTYKGTGGLAFGDIDVLVPYPASIVANDILIITVMDAASDTFSTPAGWTAVASDSAETNASHAIFYKRAVGGESGTELVSSLSATGNYLGGVMYAFSNCITSGVPYEKLINDTFIGASSKSRLFQQASSQNNSLAVALVLVEDDTLSSIAGTGWTQQSVLGHIDGSDGSYGLATAPSDRTIPEMVVATNSATDFIAKIILYLIPTSSSQVLTMGVISASATTVGILIPRSYISANENNNATTSGALIGKGRIISLANGIAATQGVLTAKGIMLVTVNALATTVGVLKGTAVLSTTANGVATTVSVLNAKGLLLGVSNISLTNQGIINGIASIQGVVNAATTILATIRSSGIVVTVNASANLVGVLKGLGTIIGVSNPLPTLTGSLQAKGQLSGTVSGLSIIAGTGVLKHNIVSSISGQTSTQSVLIAKGTLSGTIAPALTITGSLSAKIFAQANITGSSALVGALTSKGFLLGTSSGTSSLWSNIARYADIPIAYNTYWDTTDEGWVFTSGGKGSGTWQNFGGNPGGCWDFHSVGRNNTDTSFIELTTTWEALGVPAGSVVKSVTLPKIDWQVDEVLTSNGGGIGPMELLDSGGVLQATFFAQEAFGGAVTSFVTKTGSTVAVPIGLQASNSTIKFRLSALLNNGNNGSAITSVHVDNFSINSIVQGLIIGIGATSNAQATTSAEISSIISQYPIEGVISASAITQGDLIGKASITSISNGLATTAGVLNSNLQGSVVVNTTTITFGILTAKGNISSTANASATTSGILASELLIYAESFGVATLAGTLLAKGTMAQNIYGSAITSGVLTSKILILGEAVQTATTSGILLAKGSLSVTVNANATTSAVLVSDAVIGSINTAATTSGILKGKTSLSASSNASASTSGSLVAKGSLATWITGLNVFFGDLTAIGTISALSNGSAITVGVIIGKGVLETSVNGSASVSATIIGLGVNEGSANGATTASGVLLAKGSLNATINAFSTTTATIGSGAMAASINGTATLFGLLNSNLQGSVIVNTTTITFGTLQAKGELTGLIINQSTSQGVVGSKAFMTAQINAQAVVSGNLVSDAIAVTVNGSASTQGVLTSKGILLGTSNAIAQVQGNMGSEINISGTSFGQTTTSSLLKGKGLLLGESNGVISVSASLLSKGTLAANTLSQAILSGSLTAEGILTGNSEGVALLSGTLTSDEMNAVSNGSSFTEGILTAKASLSGQANGLSSLTIFDNSTNPIDGGSISINETSGKLTAFARLNGLAQGSSVVTGKVNPYYTFDKDCLINVLYKDVSYAVKYVDTEHRVEYVDKNYYVNYHCKK